MCPPAPVISILIFKTHEYFDSNGSGSSLDCQTQSSFENYVDLSDFINWMHQNSVKVFLSEFGSGSEQNCVSDVTWLLQQMSQNPYRKNTGGFIGWTAWVGGHGWNLSNFNNLTPDETTGAETTQMVDIYEPNLTAP